VSWCSTTKDRSRYNTSFSSFSFIWHMANSLRRILLLASQIIVKEVKEEVLASQLKDSPGHSHK
jgi:hypothetical protein